MHLATDRLASSMPSIRQDTYQKYYIVMARPPRIEYPGAFYHVIVRGNQRQDIFLDDYDRSEYLVKIKHYKEKCGFVLYAYVLMSNHVHLLIETQKSPISKIMHRLNCTYVRYFNKKYGKVGHLFQGRYTALLCDRNEYLLGLVRYIHLNPVRARIVDDPHKYRWSSHKDYLDGNKKLIDAVRVLKLFSETIPRARRLYEEFVYEAIGRGKDESFYKAINQQIIGGENFIDKVEEKIEHSDRSLRKPPSQSIFRAIEDLTGIGREELVSRSRKGEVIFARGLLVSVWREVGYSMTDLQNILRRDLSVLSRLCRVTESAGGRSAMRQLLKKLNA